MAEGLYVTLRWKKFWLLSSLITGTIYRINNNYFILLITNALGCWIFKKLSFNFKWLLDVIYTDERNSV